MKRRILFLFVALFLAGDAGAQEQGSWRAASKTAESITGDVAFGEEKITIDYLTFPIAEIRALTPAEATALFDADTNAMGRGHLFRMSVPAAKKFLHKNTLCGSEETEWMATYVSGEASGRTLQMAFFSGQKMPVMTAEALGNSTNLCGTFTYAP